jgi:seryl-tRNA synthetase
MEDKIGIGRGITGDELEKQLQEELGETNPETTEIKEEDKLEKELNNQVEVLGKKSNAVEKTYEEVGGEQGVQEVLAKMEPSQKEALSLALEEKLKSLIAERSKMNSNLADTVDGLIPGFLKADEKVTFTDIMAGMSGFVAGLAGSLAAGQGLLGKQLEDFVNNPAGGGHDFATM